MYSRIEEQFMNKSHVLQNKGKYLGSLIVLILVETGIAYFLPKEPLIMLIFAVCADVLFFILCYVYIVITNWKFIEQPWRKILRFSYNKAEYQKRLQQKDLEILKEILEQNNINTRTEIKEIMRHYQCFLPRQTKRSVTISSIVAIVVSIWALIYKESIDYALYNVLVILMITIIIIILYGCTIILYNELFKIFGKTAMYSRLESALAEIYVNSPIAKRKSKPKQK